MRIDPHVHCRDGRERHKETIEHVLRLCDEQGVGRVFDMPNTDPPVLTASDAEQRLLLVPPGARGRYGLYMGVTADEAQIEAAARLVRDEPAIVGLKLYAGRSVGALAVADGEDQRRVYRTLAGAGYSGVLAVHCEKESCFGACGAAGPAGHGRARPAAAEIESVRDQVAFAAEAGFAGVLHICHVSTAGALDLVRQARGRLRITCGATPHHLLWDEKRMRRPDGALYKVNPPLRAGADVLALRAALVEGGIDWIETDHAPHALVDKLAPPYSSGFPSLMLYRELVEKRLPEWGVSEECIRGLTSLNIMRAFTERKAT